MKWAYIKIKNLYSLKDIIKLQSLEKIFVKHKGAKISGY